MTREEAIDYLLDPIGKREKHDEAIRMAIEALERQHGKNISEDGFLCSVCTFGDFGGFHGYEPNFCPNCGAEMEHD